MHRRLGRSFKTGSHTLKIAQIYIHIEDRSLHVLATSDGEPVNPYKLCEEPLEHVLNAPESVLALNIETERHYRYCPLCRGFRPHATR